MQCSPVTNPGPSGPSWVSPQNTGRSWRVSGCHEAPHTALTWQDEVLALVHTQGLLQALLHSFDLLPARQEAEDPTWRGAPQA